MQGMDTDTSPLKELIAVMQRLRDPQNGCAWDIKQTFRSIAPFTIEEAYEVADAIERDDINDLQDELGDLLFQVVFHAQMATEAGQFTFDDVAQGIVDKMIRRHPHVFGDVVYASEEELKTAWEAIKAKERLAKAQRKTSATTSMNSLGTTGREQSDVESEQKMPSALEGISSNLPALKYADKLQKRAARVGFDWPSIAPVWDKLDEEIAEVRAAIESGDSDAIEDELGDLLFTVVNLTRHCSVDAENALRRASGKFEGRFRCVEQLAGDADLADMNEQALDALWERAKRN